MASLKDVKLKIGGVKKTKQITKAMNMVASAKLRGAQQRIERFRPYAQKFFDMLSNLGGQSEETAHPFLAVRDEVKTVGIVLATSDRGLCGSFNVNIITAALKIAREKTKEGKAVKFYCVGKKARDAVRKLGYEIPLAIIGQMNSFDFQLAVSVGQRVMDDFLSGQLDEVLMVYGEFISLAKQVPVSLPVLPIAADHRDEHAEGAAKNYIYEPAVEGLLAELLPRFVKVQIYRGLLDTSASEHAARMMAMDNATKNCDDMTAALTLLYNKTRQAAITKDLMDIVGGVEALKG
ncbi:MAG: F0F1 ATP synthase subunit gamma [Desulfovibrio sp.]|jgi:F-type H+-transporting ATPase subunit gamma|nr:F0F1 ATP synthase subunit gamma [Desulfovibrio sp.]